MTSYASHVRNWLWGSAAIATGTAPGVSAEYFVTTADAPSSLMGSVGSALQLLRQAMNNVWSSGSPQDVLLGPIQGLLGFILKHLPSPVTKAIQAIMNPTGEWNLASYLFSWVEWLSPYAGRVAAGATGMSLLLPASVFVLNTLVSFAVGGLIRRIYRRTDGTFIQIDSYFSNPPDTPNDIVFSSEFRIPGIGDGASSWITAILSTVLLNPYALYIESGNWANKKLREERTNANIARSTIKATILAGIRVYLTPIKVAFAVVGLSAFTGIAALLVYLQALAVPLALLGVGFTSVAGLTSATGVVATGYLGVLGSLTALVAYWKYRIASGVSVVLRRELDEHNRPTRLRLLSLQQNPVSNHRIASIVDGAGKLDGVTVPSAYHQYRWILARLTLPVSVDTGLMEHLGRFFFDAYTYDRLAVRQALFRIQLGMLRSGTMFERLQIDLPPERTPGTPGWPSVIGDALDQWQGKQLTLRNNDPQLPDHLPDRPPYMEWTTPYVSTWEWLQRVYSADQGQLGHVLYGVHGFRVIAPFLLRIQQKLLEREVDIYTISEIAPFEITVGLEHDGDLPYSISLRLEPWQQIDALIDLPQKSVEFERFLTVRELPGDDLYPQAARVILWVREWNAAFAPFMRIVLPFLHFLCWTLRWYLYVPFHGPMHPTIEGFMEKTDEGIPPVGYKAFTSPGKNSTKVVGQAQPVKDPDRLEALLMDHLRKV